MDALALSSGFFYRYSSYGELLSPDHSRTEA